MKISSLFWLILVLLPCSAVAQQHDLNKSVLLHAEITLNPPSIKVIWEKSFRVQSTKIYRKKAESPEWGEPVAVLRGNAHHYIDKDVVRGKSYEYKVTQKFKNSTAYGYMFSAIGKPVVHFRGKLILVVDNTFSMPLREELNRFRSDLEGDGWHVIRVDVNRDASPVKVKERIKAAYLSDPDKTKALILLGHIPVPYSGNLNPDKHIDHKGAWPADTYYADMDGEWTDYSVNYAEAKDPRHHNVPNDGKFDQNLIPSTPELQTGRIDFAKLDFFAEPEVELLKAYLDKNHRFRHKLFEPEARGLIENNFTSYKEGFAQNGWKNFSPLVGPSKIKKGDYSEDLKLRSYLWSYGCGAGSYARCKGIISSKEFSENALQSVFNLLFGSYFGDWDSQNNLLRSSLASGTILTSCWAGRPNWQFHHMSLGNPIGYSVVLSQKNHKLYNPGFGARNIHMGLMGDPTLRMKMVAPPDNVTAKVDKDEIIVAWEVPDDEIIGYHVYRKQSKSGTYQLLTPQLVTANVFQESCIPRGEYFYMVRAIKLESSPSGSYYNLSQGSFSPAVKVKRSSDISPSFEFFTDDKKVSFTNLSKNAEFFRWDFGDGIQSEETNPAHVYSDYGSFDVKLEAGNSCGQEGYTFRIDLSKEKAEETDQKISGFNIFPNPSSEFLNIHIYSNSESDYKVRIFDLDTRLQKENRIAFQGSSTLHALDIRDLSKGVYIVQVYDHRGKIGAKKFILN